MEIKKSEEILAEIYRNCQLALESISDILPEVEDEELKTEIMRQHEEYEKICGRAACLARDKAKCHVLPMSELCLTQFTRKRVGFDVLSYLVKPCAHCHSVGYVPEDIFVVTRIRADILDCFASGYHSAVVELNEGICRRILSEGLLKTEAEGALRNKRVYLIPHKTFQEFQYSVRGDNSGVLHLPDKAQILY